MASPERRPADRLALEAEVAKEAPRRPFFPLIALLEQLAGGPGRVGDFAGEPVRFRHDPSLAFSAADVVSVQPLSGDSGGSSWEVVTSFLGLFGSSTPIPSYLSEEVAQEDPDRQIRRQFFDLFHHRLLALLFKAWSNHVVGRQLRRDGQDEWSRRVLALAGFDTWAHPLDSGLPPGRLLRACALLATRGRTARALEAILEDVLEEPLAGGRVQVRQFVGGWAEIAPGDRTRLGVAQASLGQSTVLGRRTFDAAAKIEIVLGPVSAETYPRFGPEGDQLPLIRKVVDLFGRDPIDYDLVVTLAEDAAPRIQLSSDGRTALGRNSWLGAPRGGQTQIRIPASP